MTSGPPSPDRRRTVRLIVEYDGTSFSGWQVQHGAQARPTVQGVLADALGRMCQEPVSVRGASRTDAGVHARGQVAAFDTTRGQIPLVGFERGPRAFLPPEVVVRRAEVAPPGWDPRRAARGKRYVYTFWNDRAPAAIDRARTWWIRRPLDLDRMREAARDLLGTHDFEAFRAAGCVAKHAVRTLYALDLRPGAHARVELEVVGNAFVRNMVRIIAGTLAEVGVGKRSPDSVRDVLARRSRAGAGMTAPPQGLCLEEVIYDDRLPPRPEDDRDLSS